MKVQRILVPFLLLGSVLFHQSPLHSQCGQYWEWQYPVPQAHIFNDVHALNGDSMIAVANHGTIGRTTDGGDSWDIQSCVGPGARDLSSIHMSDPQNGWVVGSDGTVLHTDDMGDSWDQQADDVEEHLFDVFSMDGGSAWIVGASGTLLFTDNGGNDWEDRGAGISRDLQSVHFIDDSTGWVVGEGGSILSTQDQGQNWQVDTSGILAFGDTVELYGVHFQDDSTGWAVGGFGIILRTTDQGMNWVRDTIDGVHYTLFDVDFKGSDTGRIVGRSGGRSIRTTDGGGTWTEGFIGNFSNLGNLLSTNFRGLDYAKDGSIWLVGRGGAVLKKWAKDTAWDPISKPYFGDLRSVHFTNAYKGWAVGGDDILHTKDMGMKWKKPEPGTGTNSSAVHFPTADTGWVAGDFIFHRTRNQGDDWTALSADDELNDLHFIDGNTGWIVGDWGTIYQIDDGNYTDHSIEVGVMMNAVHVLSSGEVWILKISGNVQHSTDGGSTWNGRGISADQPMNDIYFVNSEHGWMVGEEGTIYYTEDGGKTWDEQASWTSSDLNGLYLLNEDRGWIAADEGIVLRTDDGGEEWHRQYTGTHNNLFSIHFENRDTGWVVGGQGTILHTKEGGGYTGLSHHEKESQDRLSVFPNPAKDRLNVKLPAKGPEKIRLRIHNTQGRLVKDKLMRNANADRARSIPIGSLQPGIYILEAEWGEADDMEREAQRVVVR